MIRIKRTPLICGAAAISAFLLILAIRSAAQDTVLVGNRHHRQPPQPQGFCGYCHILTYPDVINKSYETWKKSKHNQIGCIQCHYKPSQTATTQPDRPNDRQPLPIVPPGNFSYIALGGQALKTTTTVYSPGCATAECHGKPDDTFRSRKITYKDKIAFVHEPHFDKSKQIEGMDLDCTVCHQHMSDQRHFQVSETTCHLCHFANTQFNKGRSRCEQCHQLPTEPIQSADTPDAKPITHGMLKDAGVSCEGCHYDIIQGSGRRTMQPLVKGQTIKTVMVIGSGLLEKQSCLKCHDRIEDLDKAGDKKQMHRTHVNPKTARCIDCHNAILHGTPKAQRPMPDSCRVCHSRPHQYQRFLVAGTEHSGVDAQPDPMFKGRVNCLGCHTEDAVGAKGQAYKKASAKTCTQCHAQDYARVLGLWQKEVSAELKKALALEKEALQTLKRQKNAAEPRTLKETQEMIRDGQEALSIVRFGNGVHNAKYAIALLDWAMVNFKDATALLQGKEISEPAFMEE